MDIELPNNWAPRQYQKSAWAYLRDGGRRAAICWPRRHGKDDIALHQTAIKAHERVGSYWHLLPEQAQARKAIWTQVNPHTGKRRIDEAFPVALRKRTNDQEMFIEFLNGSTWQIAGSDNYNSLVGSSPCGIVFSEYALANPAAWAYLRPILRENKGWAIFISTPRGKNHFYHMIELAKTEPDWFAEVLTCDDTNLISKEELAADLRELQAEHGESYGKSIWLQENFCSFDAAIPGAIWAESLDRLQLNGAICDFDVSRTSPVFTGWDLGRTDDTAIWFYQFRGKEIDVVDFWSGSGYEIYDPANEEKSLSHILLDKARKRGYKYARHWLPHDARPRRLGMGGKSILQQFHDAAKLHPELGGFAIAPKLDVQEGIQAARKTFQLTRFHETNCDGGLQALRHYHREWDPERKMFLDSPVHDWSSHCFTGDTKVLTRYGTRSISTLPLTGEVFTLCGWKPYINPRIMRRHARLVEVRFRDGLSVKCTPDHLFLTDSGWKSAESLTRGTWIQSSLTHSPSILTAASIAYGQVIGICREAGRNFTETCGRWPLVQFLKGVISTIRTVTREIIFSQILSVSPQACTCQQRQGSSSPPGLSTLRVRQERRLQTGIGLKRGGYGTGDTWPESRAGLNGSEFRRTARSAKKSFRPFSETVGILKSIAAKSAKCRRIASVEELKFQEDVWCLTVPGAEHFSLANGAVVHNCADAWRTLSLTWKVSQMDAPEPVNQPINTSPIRWGDLVKQHFEHRARLRSRD